MAAVTASYPQKKVYISRAPSQDEDLDWNKKFCLTQLFRFEILFFSWIMTKTKPFKYSQEKNLWWNICFLIRKVSFLIHGSCHWKQSKNLPWMLEISHCKCCQNQYLSARYPGFDAAAYFDEKQTNKLTSCQICWLVLVGNKVDGKDGKGTGTLMLAVCLDWSPWESVWVGSQGHRQQQLTLGSNSIISADDFLLHAARPAASNES